MCVLGFPPFHTLLDQIYRLFNVKFILSGILDEIYGALYFQVVHFFLMIAKISIINLAIVIESEMQIIAHYFS